jgi:hypothetical protein
MSHRPPWTVAQLIAVALTGVAVFWINQTGHFGRDWSLVLVAGSVLAIVPHEFGHALAARLCGAQLVEVRIGVPGTRDSYRLSIPGLPLVFGPPRPGTAGSVRYQPALSRPRTLLTLAAGPLAGAAALGVAAAVVSSLAIRTALLLTVVLHLAWNLIPGLSRTGCSDGSKIVALITGRPLRGMPFGLDPAAAQRAHELSDQGDPNPMLEILDRALADPRQGPGQQRLLRAARAQHRYRAGRYHDSAADQAGEPKCAQAWADAMMAAVLFGQLAPDFPTRPDADAHIERAVRTQPSLATRHSLAVLLLVEGRPQDAWRTIGDDDPTELALPERAAVLATQALCAPDPDERGALAAELTAIAPWSPWARLVTANEAVSVTEVPPH